MSVSEVAVSVIAVIATAFVVLGTVGVVRFPDVLSRLHASTKAVTLGVLLALVAAELRLEDVGDVVKVALAGALLLISAPVSSHMLSRASYHAGPPPADLVEDDLARRGDDLPGGD